MKQILFAFCALSSFGSAQTVNQLPYNRLPYNTLPNSNPQPIVAAVPLPQPPASSPVSPPTTPTLIAPIAPITYGAFGQVCDTVVANPRCQTVNDILTSLSTPGFIQCRSDFDCCLCAAIECHDCIGFVAGNSGVYGVGAIMIHGRDVQSGGAQINCMGVESCRASVISSTNIKTMAISGDMGIQNAVVTITNPAPGFVLECTGMASCEGLRLEIIIPALAPGEICSNEPFMMDGIECSGPEACKFMDVTIRNDGCNKVLIETLECTEIDSCIEANFNLIGDIDIVNCDLGASGHTATGISKCYQNLQKLFCRDPGSCRGIVKTLTNPNDGFTLQCSAEGSCQNAQLTVNLDASPWWDPVSGIAFAQPTSWLGGFVFHGKSAGAMATITVNNEQRGMPIEIESIVCLGLNACAQTTFVIGNDVQIENILCDVDTCSECLIKINPTDPGVPCTEYMFI